MHAKKLIKLLIERAGLSLVVLLLLVTVIGILVEIFFSASTNYPWWPRYGEKFIDFDDLMVNLADLHCHKVSC